MKCSKSGSKFSDDSNISDVYQDQNSSDLMYRKPAIYPAKKSYHRRTTEIDSTRENMKNEVADISDLCFNFSVDPLFRIYTHPAVMSESCMCLV